LSVVLHIDVIHYLQANQTHVGTQCPGSVAFTTVSSNNTPGFTTPVNTMDTTAAAHDATTSSNSSSNAQLSPVDSTWQRFTYQSELASIATATAAATGATTATATAGATAACKRSLEYMYDEKAADDTVGGSLVPDQQRANTMTAIEVSLLYTAI
jgi:hypothetical protein